MAASLRNMCSLRIINNIRQLTSVHQLTSRLTCVKAANLHTTALRPSLMEFFDDEKNWGAMEVKSGRSWKLEELRIKSNEDLHKLWYVLLKERNMLLTMEYASQEEVKIFPNPERLDKVKDSMANIEQVVRERNEAFWQLEIGEQARAGRPSDEIDTRDRKAVVQKAVDLVTQIDDGASVRFLQRLKEQQTKWDRRELTRRRNHVMGLLKRFPNLDVEALKEQYPEIDVDKIKLHKKTLGHHDSNTA